MAPLLNVGVSLEAEASNQGRRFKCHVCSQCLYSCLQLYNDLWSLDCESWTWELIPCTTTPPCSRMGSSMIGVLDKLALFGGWDGSSTFNDFWMFDLSE